MKCPHKNCNNEATRRVKGAAGIFQVQCITHASQAEAAQERGAKMLRIEQTLQHNKQVRAVALKDDDIRHPVSTTQPRNRFVSLLLSIIN